MHGEVEIRAKGYSLGGHCMRECGGEGGKRTRATQGGKKRHTSLVRYLTGGEGESDGAREAAAR